MAATIIFPSDCDTGCCASARNIRRLMKLKTLIAKHTLNEEKTHQQIWKVSGGGESPKNKGKPGEGGYGGGSLEAGKGHRRGKPYNFAKPQAAQNSKPQPCAASFSIFASFCFQVSSLMFKPQILEILIANLKYTCRHSFMICINRLVLTFWLFNLTI